MEFKIKVIIFRHNSALVVHTMDMLHMHDPIKKENSRTPDEIATVGWIQYGPICMNQTCTPRHSIQMKP